MKKIILCFLLLTNFVLAAAPIDLRSVAEKSNWKITGRADETARLCKDFQKKFPTRVRCMSFGLTPEKRDHLYLMVGNPKNPVIWVQAGIHAGEIDGKDAIFYLLKEILQKEIKPDPLEGLCLVFLPIVNLDGHERFGKWNRPNQIGPEEMGWRTTAQNLNLNRDFMKVDAPEMKNILRVWHKLNPVLSLDLHVTNGAQFQPEVGLIILPYDDFGSSYEKPLLEKMKARGHMALPYYPSFEVDDDPLSGFARYVSAPRFSHSYWFNNNRLGMLVETHSWKNYANRVKSQHDTVLSTLEIAQVNARDWKKREQAMDEKDLSAQKVDLEFKHTDKHTLIDFPGYKFTKKRSLVSGAEVIKYDPLVLENWRVPLYEELKATFTVMAPLKGYYIQPADVEWMTDKFAVHGIRYEKVTKPFTKEMEVFRATKAQFSLNSFEGHQTLAVEGEWKKEAVQIPLGSLFVPIHQAKGRLILQLLEPRAQDSFLSWGFFNKAFESKEYMEKYVAEDVAMEMLKNAGIRKEFEEKLKSDPEFEKSPDRRFEFFYRKHSSWDERFNRYPIFKD